MAKKKKRTRAKKLTELDENESNARMEKIFKRQHMMMQQGVRLVTVLEAQADPALVAEYAEMKKCMEDAVAAYEA